MSTETDFGEFSTFGDAAAALMAMLNQLHALDAWFITRARLDDWIVTHLYGDAAYLPGQRVPVAPAERERILRGVPKKTNAESALDAYVGGLEGRPPDQPGVTLIGAPLVVRDELYGVLCGIASSPAGSGLDHDWPSVMAAARILSTILRRELEAEELLRRAERAEAEALVDELTGLFNRRGWERLVEREEARSMRYGHAATVVIMDVDGLKSVNDQQGHAAGDRILTGVAAALRTVIREHDVAARLGGDEFGILAVEYDDDGRCGLFERLQHAFAGHGLTVSLGLDRREHQGGIAAAIVRADAAMYAYKAARSATAIRRYA
jgi:diguanylate cyclase